MIRASSQIRFYLLLRFVTRRPRAGAAALELITGRPAGVLSSCSRACF